LTTEPHMSARDIDDAVSRKVRAGQPIYTLDAERIRAAQPDLILAQDLCEVCAVPSGAVEDALGVLGCRAEVLSLDPSTLDEVIGCIGLVGAATGTGARAAVLMEGLRDRVERVRCAVADRHRPRTLALEWADPPFNGGHWIPDMISAAGGDPILGTAGAPSRRLSWPQVADAAPDIVVFMPCGYDLTRATEEGATLLEVPALSAATEMYAVHANAYFSRPGPRIVAGVECLAGILHPDALLPTPTIRASRLR